MGHRKQTHRRRQQKRLWTEEELILNMPPLTVKKADQHLKTTTDWSRRGQTIRRTFKFEGFLDSMAFVNRIARKAQKMDHHPDIDVRYDKVTLRLTTHDEGGLTAKDFALARQCDEVFSKFTGS